MIGSSNLPPGFRHPPYRILPHLQAAFGSAFGILNLLVGAVSIARQCVRAFDVGLSPVLKNIFAAYVSTFHGLVTFFAGAISWLTGFKLIVPAWAHDWIILWFVLAGAAYRLVVAANKLELMEIDPQYYTPVPGLLFSFLSRLAPAGAVGQLVARVIWYVACVTLWPVVLMEALLLKPNYQFGLGASAAGGIQMRISYSALFFLQTVAIVYAIFGLSILNAQTM